MLACVPGEVRDINHVSTETSWMLLQRLSFSGAVAHRRRADNDTLYWNGDECTVGGPVRNVAWRRAPQAISMQARLEHLWFMHCSTHSWAQDTARVQDGTKCPRVIESTTTASTAFVCEGTCCTYACKWMGGGGKRRIFSVYSSESQPADSGNLVGWPRLKDNPLCAGS